jgi:hypothetical protein
VHVIQSQGGCRNPEVKEWANRDEGRYYGAFEVPWIKYVEPDYLDPDTDGDGMLDAEDDQDRDDVPNFSELDIRCSDGLEDPQPRRTCIRTTRARHTAASGTRCRQ